MKDVLWKLVINYKWVVRLNFDINSTFYIKNLDIYKTQQSISNDPFETLALLSLSLAQNEHVNVTLDGQVVFTMDDELQWILVYEIDDWIQTILGLSKRHHSNLILIFESVIGAAMNYTRRGRVLPTLEKLMGTSYPRHGSHIYMIYDDGG